MNGVEVQHLPIDDPNDHPFDDYDSHDAEGGHTGNSKNSDDAWKWLEASSIGRHLISLTNRDIRPMVPKRNAQWHQQRAQHLTRRWKTNRNDPYNNNQNPTSRDLKGYSTAASDTRVIGGQYGNGDLTGPHGHGGGWGDLQYRYNLADNVTTIVYFRDGLKPNTSYSFTIVYVYEYGDYGKPSRQLNVTTLPAEPEPSSSSTGGFEPASSSSSTGESSTATAIPNDGVVTNTPLMVDTPPSNPITSTSTSPMYDTTTTNPSSVMMTTNEEKQHSIG
jgi:hypothetical protein